MVDKEKDKVINLLKTAKGQIDSIINMIEVDKQCSEILTQFLAVQGLLKKSNSSILECYLKNCIKESFENGEGDEKINEFIQILNKFYKM